MPDGNAPHIATLDWAVVTAVPVEGDPDDWVRIASPKGFVRRIDLRSPVDYRLALERRQGHWAIAAFVAGD